MRLTAVRHWLVEAFDMMRSAKKESEFFSCRVGRQWLGLPIAQVLEVIVQQQLTPMPLAPASVLGLINLRGRIITEVDVRKLMQMDSESDGHGHVVIVRSPQGEDVGLLVDEVGEVAGVDYQQYENTPDTLDQLWQQVGEGVINDDKKVTVIVNVGRLLALSIPKPAQIEGAEQQTLH